MTQVIIGIDPGTNVTGYGIIKMSPHAKEPIDFGCIRPPKDLPTSKRYLALFTAIDELLETYKPHALAVETQFMYKNAQSALKLGMARAMAILASARRDIPVFEYAPRQAKLAVVGNGAASKFQVQKMIQLHLKLSELPEPEDAADALALAICHGHTIQFK